MNEEPVKLDLGRKGDWLHYSTTEGLERYILVSDIVAILEDSWVDPSYQSWDYTRIRTKNGKEYRVPHHIQEVKPLVVGDDSK